jgi:hypothetical protein
VDAPDLPGAQLGGEVVDPRHGRRPYRSEPVGDRATNPTNVPSPMHCVPRPRRPSLRSPATQAAPGRSLRWRSGRSHRIRLALARSHRCRSFQ